MSVRLFLGYFLALTVCATVAFASSEQGSSAATDSISTERTYAERTYAGLSLPPSAVFHVRSHKAPLRPVRFALAQ